MILRLLACDAIAGFARARVIHILVIPDGFRYKDPDEAKTFIIKVLQQRGGVKSFCGKVLDGMSIKQGAVDEVTCPECQLAFTVDHFRKET
jgi:hypothetical protein